MMPFNLVIRDTAGPAVSYRNFPELSANRFPDDSEPTTALCADGVLAVPFVRSRNAVRRNHRSVSIFVMRDVIHPVIRDTGQPDSPYTNFRKCFRIIQPAFVAPYPA